MFLPPPLGLSACLFPSHHAPFESNPLGFRWKHFIVTKTGKIRSHGHRGKTWRNRHNENESLLFNYHWILLLFNWLCLSLTREISKCERNMKDPVSTQQRLLKDSRPEGGEKSGKVRPQLSSLALLPGLEPCLQPG